MLPLVESCSTYLKLITTTSWFAAICAPLYAGLLIEPRWKPVRFVSAELLQFIGLHTSAVQPDHDRLLRRSTGFASFHRGPDVQEEAVLTHGIVPVSRLLCHDAIGVRPVLARDTSLRLSNIRTVNWLDRCFEGVLGGVWQRCGEA